MADPQLTGCLAPALPLRHHPIMIHPNSVQTAGDVASHYDELDPIYRSVWGEHVHHGLWASGRESPTEAVEALADLVGERLAPEPRQQLIDIGCGYGATAARLAERYSVHVTGLTLSLAQHRIAAARPGRLAFHVRDWLDNRLPDATFDHGYAIESSEHMVDKPRFFAEAQRVLKSGGRLVVCAWLAAPELTAWQVRHLLEPICREGRLPSMGSRADYEEMAEAAGFELLSYEDLSARVARTWTLCLKGFAKRLFTDRDTRRLAFARTTRNRLFMLSLPRLIWAYRTGAMRYGLFVFANPQR
jgi:tocopherol O-methyltransferase